MADSDVLAGLRARIASIESEGSASPVSVRGGLPNPPGPSAGSAARDAGSSPFVGLQRGARSKGARNGKGGEGSSSGERDFSEESALRRIERLANVSEQCSGKLRSRLLQEGWKAEQVEGALERARACLLVDDERYASVFVRSRLAQRKGEAGILFTLKGLGYEEDYVRALVQEQRQDADLGTEVDRALELLAAKPPKSKNLHDGAYRKLVSAGYTPSVASEAATLFCEELR